MNPLDYMKFFGNQLMMSAGSPDPVAAAAKLAQFGDPVAFSVLFPETLKWNPAQLESDPLLMQRPQIAGDTQPPAPITEAKPAVLGKYPAGSNKLTPEQMEKLMSLMTNSGADMRMPQAPAPQPGVYRGDMQQVQLPQQPFNRLSLAQLLYGTGRR